MGKKALLEGKKAIVTGSSRGIGRAVALRFAQEGAWVLINCVKAVEKAQEVQKEIEAKRDSGEFPKSAGAEVGAFSVANKKEVDELIGDFVKKHGGVDILVNNAGITRDNLMLRHSEEDWDAVLETNLKGSFLCSRAVTRPMMKSRSGSIINLSSVSGEKGNPGQCSYAASKAGILGLTRSLALELSSRSIRVNAVSPGFIRTEMTEGVLSAVGEEKLLGSIPLGRLGESADIANACVWLASEESSYVTGQVIRVNGGLYM